MPIGMLMTSARHLIAVMLVISLWSAGEAFAQENTPEPQLPPAPSGQHWRLSYDDEFDGKTLDPFTWTINGDVPRYGGWWLRNLACLDGRGHLILSSSQNRGKMATAGIETRGKRQWLYGFFVVRAKLPWQPAGHRPAFWLKAKGANTLGDGGHDGAEIDVFEEPDRSGLVDHNIHWDMNPNLAPQVGEKTWAHHRGTVPITYNAWHTFGLWWTPMVYAFYIDGKLSWKTDAGGVSHVPEAMLITDEVLPSDPLARRNYLLAGRGDDFVLDYARVYQLESAR